MLTFPTPSENAFEHLARTNPNLLKEWISSGNLRTGFLSFALESLGGVPGNKFINTIIGYLSNNHAIIREGAIYALSHHLDNEEVAKKVQLASLHDYNENVRKAALEIINETSDKS